MGREDVKTPDHRNKTYTKRDIVLRVAEARSENVRKTSKWVDQVFITVREILMTADPDLRIEIRDFGVLEVKPTKLKPNARDPRSGKIISIPSRRKTHFKPGKLLRNFLSQPLENHPRRRSMPQDRRAE